VQTYLKLGTTAAMLEAVEAGAIPDSLLIVEPVEAVWQISHDRSLSLPIEMEGGRTMTALEAQWQYLEWVSKYMSEAETGEVFGDVMRIWEEILTDLERDPLLTADRLDWTAKLRLLHGYRDRDGLDWDDAKIRLLDLQYHDVDPRRGLYNRLAAAGRMQRLFSEDEVDRAVRRPPEDTRAYFRGECVSRFGESLVAANWDSLVFDIGEESLRRVPMMEPLRGGRARVGELLDRADTPAELLRALGGEND
jgi:proteasome accessory factor A